MPDETPTIQPLAPLPDPFYPDPDWAARPPDEWILVEVKGGVELSKTNLSQRPSWLMGRAADQVHLPMQHPSISRCHARIAFDKTGVPWLRDCKSTHGVFVNKKRLPPEAVGAEESHSTKKGARGVVLYPGDVIQLGASTRLHCLEGPEQFQRGRIRIPPPTANKPKMPAASVAKPPEEDPAQEEEEEEDAGVSWGISMDDEVVREEEESIDEAMKRQQALEQVPEKHRKAYEKIQALKYKLKNIQTENERIRRKGELTQGQENQLKRNNEREQQIGEQILTREKELYDKINPDRPKTKKRAHQHAMGDDDDVDDFFDRTKESNDNDNNNSGEGETEESLIAKWKDLQAQQKRKDQILERAQQSVANLQLRLDRLQAAGDDEAFFAQNDLTLAQDQLAKVESRQKTIQKDLEETKRLLKIVNPNIVWEEEPKKKIVDDGAIMPPPMLPPPMRKPAAAPVATSSPSSDNQGMMMPPPMMPPPKRKRTAEPPPAPEPEPESKPTPQPQQPAHTSPNKSNNSSSKGKVKGPARGPPPAPMGTLAALTAVSSAPGSKGTTATKNTKPGAKQPATTIDLKKDEWQAPKDQDGSGITKLNAKFAGRY